MTYTIHIDLSIAIPPSRKCIKYGNYNLGSIIIKKKSKQLSPRNWDRKLCLKWWTNHVHIVKFSFVFPFTSGDKINTVGSFDYSL